MVLETLATLEIGLYIVESLSWSFLLIFVFPMWEVFISMGVNRERDDDGSTP